MYLDGDVWHCSTFSLNAYKECQFKWNYQNVLRAKGPASLPQHVGTIVHAVLEDYHGERRHIGKSWEQAVIAEIAASDVDTSHLDLHEVREYATSMCETYETYADKYLNPKYDQASVGVESKFEIDTGVRDWEGRPVHFKGVIDRVLRNRETEELYILDYKTSSSFSSTILPIDFQMGNYLWAMSVMQDEPVNAFIYLEILRAKMEMPKVGKRGEVSVAKTQVTTAALYKSRLEEVYGSVEEAPEKNQEFYRTLGFSDNEYGNAGIKYTEVRYGQERIDLAYRYLVYMIRNVLNSLQTQALYPSPTRDCSRLCAFQMPCQLQHEGRDQDAYDFLENNFGKH